MNNSLFFIKSKLFFKKNKKKVKIGGKVFKKNKKKVKIGGKVLEFLGFLSVF